MMDEGRAALCRYWDASALVRLVADDPDEAPGRDELRNCFFRQGPHYATSHCLAEALSAFKLKWLKHRITQLEYVRDVREFYRLVVSHLSVDEVPVSAQVLDEAERLMTEYGLDFIDCIQVVTVLHGRFSVLTGASRSLFITADRRLAVAAEKEGVRVWKCSQGTPAC